MKMIRVVKRLEVMRTYKFMHQFFINIFSTSHLKGEKEIGTFTAVKPQVFVEASKANDAVSFYKAAFGAEELNRVTNPKRKADQELPVLVFAEIKLAGSSFIIFDLSDSSALGLVFCLETEDIEVAPFTVLVSSTDKDGYMQKTLQGLN